ncbi:hypothetical protein HT118_08080 [Escherichia coli]|nr:hypothetical protein [Escherichia coli]
MTDENTLHDIRRGLLKDFLSVLQHLQTLQVEYQYDCWLLLLEVFMLTTAKSRTTTI